MAEYIEREALLNNRPEGRNPIQTGKQEYNLGWNDCRHTFVECILGEPAADVAPVVHGRWDDCHFVKVDCPKSGFPTVKCSNCEIAFCDLINNHHFMYHYCPNCGARMDGE